MVRDGCVGDRETEHERCSYRVALRASRGNRQPHGDAPELLAKEAP
jgi:hypothetical protein